MLRAKDCCAATFSKSIKMPFMLRAGTVRLMFQRVLDLSIVIFRCRSTRSYRIARRPLYWLSIIRASSGRVTMSYSRDMPPIWYEALASSVIRGIDPLIMTICLLWGCLPEITVEDIRVVDGHHFVAANFDGQLLYDSPVQVLNHGPVGIVTVQRDRKGQPCGSGDNHIVFAKVGEQDKQLLVLVDAARIVGDDHRLSQSFDTQRLAEGAVRIKLTPKFA